jgi:hypothetical protein
MAESPLLRPRGFALLGALVAVFFAAEAQAADARRCPSARSAW